MPSQCVWRNSGSSSTRMPSVPGLPGCALTGRSAARLVPRATTSSMRVSHHPSGVRWAVSRGAHHPSRWVPEASPRLPRERPLGWVGGLAHRSQEATPTGPSTPFGPAVPPGPSSAVGGLLPCAQGPSLASQSLAARGLRGHPAGLPGAAHVLSMPSSQPRLKRRIKLLQLDPCILGCKSPIDLHRVWVALVLPRRHFAC